jgi:choline-glycine betaine transporter
LTLKENLPVHRPDEDKNDFTVALRASRIRKIRTKLLQIARNKFPVHEVLLAISTISLGSFLIGLLSGLNLTSPWDVYTMYILLIIGAICGTAYFFTWKSSSITTTATVKELLEDIPDPESTSEESLK